MNRSKLSVLILLLFLFASCKKTESTSAVIPIPNGDFENWTMQQPDNWRTNSCPLCLPPYETYIVQQTASAYTGQYCARLLYNSVYRTYAINSFALTDHPVALHAYVKADIIAGDTVAIEINLLKNSAVADNGRWLQAASISNFTEIVIPLSQNSPTIDSVSIKILGGYKNASQTSSLWVDNMYLEK
ncbi:MAG: hypothetical protein U0X40_07385 [Ferruginibacter sp.]